MPHSIESLTKLERQQQARELALLDRAQAAIEEATTVRQAKEIKDKAEALETYAKRVEYGGILQKRCNEIRLRAERKAGEILKDTVKTGRPKKVVQDDNYRLPDGITRDQSSKWQKIAEIPEKQFENAVKDGPSEREILRLAKSLTQDQQRKENERKIEKAPSLKEAIREGAIFSTLVVDPPWDHGDEGDQNQFGRTKPTYATMPYEAIRDLEVPHLAAENAHLYLWITNRSLPKGFDLMEAWGFRYITAITWVKPSIGVGNYYRNNTEHVLFGVRGSLQLDRADVGTWFEAPRGKRHSEKPDEFYDLIETCSPGPRIDMFARKARDGWYTWGEDGVQPPE